MDFKGKLILAPMAGYTDIPFRLLCKEFGADILVSEMISSKGLFYGDKKTEKLMRFEEFERPFGIQLFGKEPHIIAFAAEEVSHKYKPDFIDINMGCPAPKIANNGEGSALLKNPGLIYDIMKSAVSKSIVPVTAKIRIGWDDSSICAPEVAVALESAGASAITVHGRTRSQMFRPPVDTNKIAEVCKAVKIPVIANGDILDNISAVKMLRETGADSLMIGRAAVGNPFVFSIIKDELEGKQIRNISRHQLVKTMLRHLELMQQYKGKHGIVEMRKHLSSYLKGISGAKKINTQINKETDYCVLREIILSLDE